ncbi:hypothetical protein NX059_001342 [Plenodomus lindquistii]|nr:hypothetical protein NX059_001342 [Plenodomus lindquistii]
MSLQACTAATFAPSVFGTQILAIEANVLTNHSITNPFHAISVGGLDFCNITVTYTHPGQNDRIDVETWLPTNGWNKRLLAPGGGGFGAGRGFGVFGMATAVKAGFASVQTNAGIAQNPVPQNPEQMESLALLSPGNLNFYNLQNLASVSLKDEALMAKSHAKDFYGEAPEYSYWNGCSQGGRQGLMLAQRFPELYDGIVAAAPAQSWTKLFGNMLWPQQVMNREGYVPSPCELDAITNATIALCDGYDGVIDGIVSNPKACRSDADPAQFVGKQVDCSAYGQDSLVITSQAANIYAAYLDGLKTAEGKQVYPGLEPGSDPTGSFTAKMLSILVTECSENGKCVGKPNNLGITWLKYMVAKDPELDMQNLTDEEFRNLVYSGTQHYASIIGTEGTDLTKFRNRGGKMITWHGLVCINYQSATT